ncbi:MULTISPECIES: serine acetyltransferase [Citrobacter]|uniref:serine acetyltransferase n=1 Tax=Citrobacter TaxID=544 RepID=UPI0015EA9771|nr:MULTISPECIES: serine acetyltransferase [Citrobacter]EIQ7157830.1 serine acetyltransferase [Citrobacter sedlakii]MBN6596819.1 serine acetyltransferase [Citrobacter sedlakii]QMK46701.1 serine acetyltransferase [Citrobacter sp. RHB21-C05]QMK65144.1 serine acetyltransferase [Citrobacter sp. RHB21-C01]HCJ6320804.1 serine acetyltransferase [Citrobacter sedlakii]
MSKNRIDLKSLFLIRIAKTKIMPYLQIALFLLTENLTNLTRYWERELLRSKYKCSWIRFAKEYRKAKRKSHQNTMFWFWWRLANEMHMSKKHHFKLAARRLHLRLVSAFNVDVMPGAKIGFNPRIHHFSNVVISKFSDIGDNLSIKQGVTIGIKNLDAHDYVLKIGHNVDIGANSCIISNQIIIGNNVTIGAQSLVLHNIPSDTIYKNKITPVYTSKLPQPEYQEKPPFVTGSATKEVSQSAEVVL